MGVSTDIEGGSPSPSSKREKRITVNLTEQAHALLSEKAISEGMSMKAVASNAIFALDSGHKQIAIISGVVASFGAGLLGFIVGVLA